jgi:folate-binding protein YgfZ
MAVSSTSDHARLTTTCGLFDSSERGKLALSGSSAKEFLQGQVSNEVEELVPGTGCYAAFLTPKGKMLGDVRILATDSELLLDTERVALQELFNMIRRFSIGYDVQLHKRTLECALLSLIGPAAGEVVTGVPREEHSHVVVTIGGVEVRAIRTDLGIDLLCDADDVRSLTATLAVPIVSEAAVETVRIEHGRPRYGIDLDDSVIPQEAGLNERAVSFTKGCYVGQETVARLFYRGKPNRSLRGLRLSGPVAVGVPLVLEDRRVGQITSVTCSPTFGWIALGLVRREAAVGAIVAVGQEGVTAEVAELPFAATG